MKIFMALFLLFLQPCISFSQDERTEIIVELKKLAARYNQASLSFDVAFYYANEQTPEDYLDSLKGSFLMNGKKTWYNLDQTEAFTDSQYTVMLFKEDLIMYVTKPLATQYFSSLAMLDSFFVFYKNVNGSLVKLGDESKIVFTFPPGNRYKQIEYCINTKTGLLNRLKTVVQSQELLDNPPLKDSEQQSAYSIVEIRFFNYHSGEKSLNKLGIDQYFTRAGDAFMPTSSYQSYKIFLGSPNL